MKQVIKLLSRGICPIALILLTGCIYPHTTLRSPEMSGRVLDARTHTPIQGAKIFLLQPPVHVIYTDKNGNFHMKETRNFILLGIAPDGEWPDEKDASMEISHTNYMPYGFVPDWHHKDIGDILLEPRDSHN